jgi:chromosome segregation ATPase
MKTWIDAYTRINELFKENIDLTEKVDKLRNEILESQELINRLKMVEEAHKDLINAQRNHINVLNIELKDLKEQVNTLTDFINYIH